MARRFSGRHHPHSPHESDRRTGDHHTGSSHPITEPQPTWGHGFYASAHADPQYGEAEVRVAIRLMQPLNIADTIDGAEIIDRHLVGFGTEDIRDALCAAGYDGVVLHLDQSDLLVVAYYAHQVRVIIG